MSQIPLEHVLVVAAVLLAIGLAGVMIRRNLLFILLAIEVMLNAAGLAFIAAGRQWDQLDGQIMFFFILAMAAAEAAVGLAIVLLIQRRLKTIDADAASRMRG